MAPDIPAPDSAHEAEDTSLIFLSSDFSEQEVEDLLAPDELNATASIMDIEEALYDRAALALGPQEVRGCSYPPDFSIFYSCV